MATSGELEADYEWLITLNEDEMGSGSYDEETLRDKVELRAAVADLADARADGLRVELSLDGSLTDALAASGNALLNAEWVIVQGPAFGMVDTPVMLALDGSVRVPEAAPPGSASAPVM